jgi:cytoskeletal protein RodZ
VTDSRPGALGEFLRLEREKRGVSLEQVAASTKIGLRFLQLLEADQYDELPARPFIRGFVISYCRYLGIDASEVLSQFASFLESRTQSRASEQEHPKNSDFDGREAERSRRMLWALMGLFLVLGSAVLLLIKPRLKHRRVQHIEELSKTPPAADPTSTPSPGISTASLAAAPTPTPTAKTSSAPSTKPTPSATPTPTPSPKPTPEPTGPLGSVEPGRNPEETDPLNKGDMLLPAEILQKVVLKTNADSWVRYRIDDRPETTILIRAGSMIVMRASRVIRFEVADPSAMTYRENLIGSRPLSGAKGYVDKTTHRAYVFPASLREAEGDPFPDSKAFPAIPAPQSTPTP